MTEQLESLLILAGTAKDCPIYGGKRKGSAEGYAQWSEECSQ